jgi:hypothetical protein
MSYKLTHWIDDQKGDVFGDDPIALLNDWVVEWMEMYSADEVSDVLDAGRAIEFGDSDRGVRLVKVARSGR